TLDHGVELRSLAERRREDLDEQRVKGDRLSEAQIQPIARGYEGFGVDLAGQGDGRRRRKTGPQALGDRPPHPDQGNLLANLSRGRGRTRRRRALPRDRRLDVSLDDPPPGPAAAQARQIDPVVRGETSGDWRRP